MSSHNSSNRTDREISDTEVVPRAQLTQVGTSDYGDLYECPRCGHSITEYRTCSECGWDGMRQDGYPDLNGE
jgi:ribosomal protein L32